MKSTHTETRRILLITPSLRIRDGITANSINLMHGWLQAGFHVLVLNPGKTGLEIEGKFSSPKSFEAFMAGENVGMEPAEVEFKADTAVIQYAISTYWLRTYWIHKWLKFTPNKFVILLCHEPVREIQLLRSLGKWIYQRAFSRSKKVVIFSKQAGELVKSLTTNKVEVLTLPVPVRKVSQGSKLHFPQFLMLGYYLEDKGFELGLESFMATANKLRIPIGLTVVVSVRERVGSASIFSRRDRRDFKKFQTLLAGAKKILPANINILGYLTETEMEEVITGCDYLLMPYLDITNSGVAVTAKAHAIPVISSDLKPLIEAFEESAIFFKAGSLIDLQAKLESVATDPNWKLDREIRAHQMLKLAATTSAATVSHAITDTQSS